MFFLKTCIVGLCAAASFPFFELVRPRFVPWAPLYHFFPTFGFEQCVAIKGSVETVPSYRFSTGAGAGAQLETELRFSTHKNPGSVPRSWFQTGSKTLLVWNEITNDVSRRSFHYSPQFERCHFFNPLELMSNNKNELINKYVSSAVVGGGDQRSPCHLVKS